MFLFAIMGYYFFGYEEGGDKKNWGNFGIAMLSLFNYVTVSELIINWQFVHNVKVCEGTVSILETAVTQTLAIYSFMM